MTPRARRFYRNLRANYRNTNWWRTVVAEVAIQPVHAALSVGGPGVAVMDEDWDSLLVLDACRTDVFEAVADPTAFDDYRVETSAGSMTAEWTRANFAGRRFPDTVYVSANPFTTKLAGDAFYRLREVWRDAFDERHRTVLPDAVADAAREAHAAHPEKRLVVHFMQPHFPFVRYPHVQFTGWESAEIVDDEPRRGRPSDPWDALEMGVVTDVQVREAYADNLAYVLDYVYDLLDALDGRTVVTADHGNLFGERTWPVPIRLYGHPAGVRHPNLVRVPWAVVDNGPRRRVTDGAMTGSSDDTAGDANGRAEARGRGRGADVERVNERLRELGYRE